MRRSQASCLHPQPVQGQAEPHSKVPDENMDLAQPQVAGDALEPRVIGMWVLEKQPVPCEPKQMHAVSGLGWNAVTSASSRLDVECKGLYLETLLYS